MSEESIKHKKESAFSEFFKKNRSLTVLLPILTVGLIVVVILYSNPDGLVTPASSDLTSNGAKQTLNGRTVEVLPQMERVTKPDVTPSARDPFSSHTAIVPVLKGITLSDGKNTAIVETENRVYVVGTGDNIGDTWAVKKIDASGVVLEGTDGNEVVLSFVN